MENNLSFSGLFNRSRRDRRSHTSMVFLFALVVTFIMLVLSALVSPELVLAASDNVAAVLPWWAWILILFIVTSIISTFAVLGGIGSGVLFVPIIGAFFPFHLDFVREAGLLVALSGALVASPALLKKGLADLRLSFPLAVVSSVCAIVGAMIGLLLPTNVVQISLAIAILGIVMIMLFAKKSEYPEVKQACVLSTALRINGIYHEISTGQNINWQVHRTAHGFATFAIIGVIVGMLGFGAEWANIPVLNLMIGAPLRVSVASSKFLLSITNTSAAWIYINNGATLPLVIVPSIIGTMLGSVVGVKILSKTNPAACKYIVIILLVSAGVRLLLKGLGI
jgi:uncharacterized membrane protein YfcA